MATSAVHPVIDWNASNLKEEWNRFEQHVKLMFMGPMKKCEESEKAAFLLIWVGAAGREIFNSWNLSEEDSKEFDTLITNFQNYTSPKKNTVFARYMFHERRQKEEETFDNFVTDLRNLVKSCGYTNSDEMVRDRIVCGVNSQAIREKLLTEGDNLTMLTAIEISKTFETTKHHLNSMATPEAANNIDSLRKPFNKQLFKCKNCGRNHPKKQCPAFGSQCHACGKHNHWASVCESSKSKKYNNNNAKAMHYRKTKKSS